MISAWECFHFATLELVRSTPIKQRLICAYRRHLALLPEDQLPDDVRETWWRGTTRQWPFMAADLGCSMETIMAHYMSNHIAVAYGEIFGEMAALSQSLGFKVRTMTS